MARGECYTLGRASSLWRETMTIDKVPITVRGFAALEEELKHRQQVERPRIVQAIAEARAHNPFPFPHERAPGEVPSEPFPFASAPGAKGP